MPKTSIRLAKNDDLAQIMQIINQAKTRLKAAGSPQWQGNYPNEDSFIQDIAKHWSYVLIVEDQIAGVAALMQETEPSYKIIEDGNWRDPNNLHYTTIHRIAISDQFAGQHLADSFFDLLIKESVRLGFDQVRFDTHRLNYAMQHLAHKFSFEKRGIIHVQDYQDDARLAYQLLITK